MKKTTFLKKVILVCLLISAVVAQSCLMAQSAPATTPNENDSGVITYVESSKKVATGNNISFSGSLMKDDITAREPFTIFDENYSSIPMLGESNQNVLITVTPFGVMASENKITLKKGQTLVITGIVTPDIGYSFKSIAVKKNDWHFWSVLTSDDNSTQTDSSFSFNFKAYSSGKEKLTFDVVWANDKGSSKDLDDICPIEVEVK